MKTWPLWFLEIFLMLFGWWFDSFHSINSRFSQKCQKLSIKTKQNQQTNQHTNTRSLKTKEGIPTCITDQSHLSSPRGWCGYSSRSGPCRKQNTPCACDTDTERATKNQTINANVWLESPTANAQHSCCHFTHFGGKESSEAEVTSALWDSPTSHFFFLSKDCEGKQKEWETPNLGILNTPCFGGGVITGSIYYTNTTPPRKAVGRKLWSPADYYSGDRKEQNRVERKKTV